MDGGQCISKPKAHVPPGNATPQPPSAEPVATTAGTEILPETAFAEARLEAELRLSRMTSASSQELAHFTLRTARRLTRSSHHLLALVNDDGTSLTVFYSSTEHDQLATANYELNGDYVWTEAVVAMGPCVVDARSRPSDRDRTWPETCPAGGSCLVVPVLDDGRLVAVIGVGGMPGEVGPSDLAVLRQMGEGYWRVIRQREVIAALEESEKRYRLLVESMSEGLGVFDENCRITFINDRFGRMLGYRPSDLIGRSAGAILDETSQATFYEQIARKTDQNHNPYEVEWIDGAGRRVPTIVSPQPLFDAAGNFAGSIAVVTDIAALKRSEQSLREANVKLGAEQRALTEKNIALKEILAQIENEKNQIRRQIQTNVDRVLMPVLRMLDDKAGNETREYVRLLEHCLNDITSPFVSRLEIRYGKLSPREIEICSMTRNGLSSKEVAAALNTSIHTVHNQRKQIRRKLGIANKDVNLVSFLKSTADSTPTADTA